jgi:transposase
LRRFDGRLDIDSNAVERAIRPQAITRKKPCSPDPTAASAHGRPWPPPETAQMNGVDPFAWLTNTLSASLAAGRTAT